MNILKCQSYSARVESDFNAILYLGSLGDNFTCSELVKLYANKIDQMIIQDDLFHEHFRLLPLLYVPYLSSFFSEISWKKIEGIYKHTYYRNRMQLDRANKFQLYLKAVSDSSSVLLLKGASMLVAVYDDIGRRPMGDIDFFVPSFPIDDQDIINGLYKNKQMKLKSDCFRAVTLVDPQKFEYDIHRFIADNSIDNKIAKLSEKYCVTHKYKGYEFKALCPEHLFFSVLYHGITSPGVRYSKRWIVDVIRILEKYTLCHNKIIQYASCFDAPSVLLIGISELLNLPDVIINNFRISLENLFKESKRQINTESKFYRYFRVLPASPDSGGREKPISKLQWFRSVIGFYFLTPFAYRKIISIKRYYLSVLNINQNQSSIIEQLLKRIKRRFYYLILSKWIKN